jgi:cobalt-zinc-cadmium efflux system protein
LAAFANAMLLLVAMGALAWEAAGRLASPVVDTASQGVTMMAVAGVGIVVNTATAWLFMRGSKTDLNIRGAFIHMAADALVSAGVVVAGALTLWMGWAWLDAVVSLAIAGVILVGTWGLFKQSLHLLMDGVPDSVDPQAVHDCLAALPGVSQVQQLHIWATSTSRMALTAHLVMPQGHADDAFLQNANELLHDQFDITQVTLQIVTNPL